MTNHWRKSMTTVSNPMIAAKVLIIEDDPNIVDLIRSNLVVRGFDTVVSAGTKVIDLFDLEQPDIVLLDLMLPEADGFELCRELRERSAVGIIVVSARGGEQDKVTALNMGADDYMTKPFGIEELLARIHATLRRTRPAAESQAEPAPAKIAIDSLSINLVSKQVRLAGAEVRLTPTEFALLRELAVNRGKLLSRAHLLRQVWGHGYEAETEYIRVYISRLRAKLEPPGSKPLIVTRQRAGYLIPAEGRSAAGTGSADLAGRRKPPDAQRERPPGTREQASRSSKHALRVAAPRYTASRQARPRRGGTPEHGLASLGRRRPRLASGRYPAGGTQGDGDGGATTGGRSLQVMTFGKYGLSQLVPSWKELLSTPALPPRSVSVNSEPAARKWNDPQLLTPHQPILRTSTFWKVALPAERASKTSVPAPSTSMSRKCTLVMS